VRGLTLVKAKRRIRAAHCTPGAVTRVYSKKMKAGRVIRQSPGPGARFAQNHAVKLVVSRGQKPKRRGGR
jgi:beta-lactam-binding protein with PASTA domain